MIYLMAFFGYHLYLESASFIDLKLLLPFIALTYLVPAAQERLEKQWEVKQNAQIVQLLKDQIFGFDFDSAKKFQNQMDMIYTELGDNTFH